MSNIEEETNLDKLRRSLRKSTLTAYGAQKLDIEIDSLIKENKELKKEIEDWKFTKKYVEDNYIYKDNIREIVDECIQRGRNIITNKEEYQPNTNANSYLTHKILELLEEK